MSKDDLKPKAPKRPTAPEHPSVFDHVHLDTDKPYTIAELQSLIDQHAGDHGHSYVSVDMEEHRPVWRRSDETVDSFILSIAKSLYMREKLQKKYAEDLMIYNTIHAKYLEELKTYRKDLRDWNLRNGKVRKLDLQKVATQIAAMSDAERRELLHDAGLLDADGKLAQQYTPVSRADSSVYVKRGKK